MSRWGKSLAIDLKICYIDLQHDAHSSRRRSGSRSQCRDRIPRRERSGQRPLRDPRAGRAGDEGALIVSVNGALNTLNVASGGVDEGIAGELATQHLIGLGHRRIGYVAGPDYYLPTQQKAMGRESALRAAGLEADGLVAHGEFS